MIKIFFAKKLLDANQKRPVTHTIGNDCTIKENFKGNGKYLQHFPNFNLVEIEKKQKFNV